MGGSGILGNFSIRWNAEESRCVRWKGVITDMDEIAEMEERLELALELETLFNHAKTFPIQKGEPLYPFPIPEMDCFWFSLLLSANSYLFHPLILPLSGNYTAHDPNAKGCACHYPKSHSCKKHFTSLLSRLPGDWGSPQSAFGYPNAMLAKPVPSISIDSPMQNRL